MSVELAIVKDLPYFKNQLAELEKKLEIARRENHEIEYYDNLRTEIGRLKSIINAANYRVPKQININRKTCPTCTLKVPVLDNQVLAMFCPHCGQCLQYVQS
jgi:PHP family Zn ribbon phosphoesterase